MMLVIVPETFKTVAQITHRVDSVFFINFLELLIYKEKEATYPHRISSV